MERIARKELQAQLMEAVIHHMEAIVNHLSEEMTTLDQYERLVQTQMHQLGNEIMQDIVTHLETPQNPVSASVCLCGKRRNLILTRFHRVAKESSSNCLLFPFVGTPIAQRGMESLSVVQDLHIFTDDGLRLLTRREMASVRAFGFECPPETLHGGIIPTVGSSTHADLHAMCGQVMLTRYDGEKPRYVFDTIMFVWYDKRQMI